MRTAFGQTNIHTVNRPAPDSATLHSRGDIRFAGDNTGFITAGNLVLSADQIYPTTHSRGWVEAGNAASNGAGYDPTRTLRIERPGNAALSPVPASVFGMLSLRAPTIEQAGVLRAPLGLIELLGSRPRFSTDPITTSVTLLPGSVTSVSAAGLVMPYGGTVDGVSYLYKGQPAQFGIVGDTVAPSRGTFFTTNSTARGITLGGQSVDVRAGALLDLSGGGMLAGAGFVSGRGGSTDARLYPLVQTGANGGFTLPGLAANPVYALLPGWQAGQAPAAPERGAGDPVIGQRITVPAGVPGLPAGTYTLLPSTYALLPGAFRVELHPGQTGSQPLEMRNGSWMAGVVRDIANTGLRDAVPVQATFTAADVLRRYSQYNETSYSAFALAEAQRQGGTRAMLPADAAVLTLTYLSRPGQGPALSFAGQARFNAAQDGHAGRLQVAMENTIGINEVSRMEIVGANATPGFQGVSLRAADLNAVDAPQLIIGGRLAEGTLEGGFSSSGLPRVDTTSPGRSGVLTFVSDLNELSVRDGASLRASEVFLLNGKKAGVIDVAAGARINTIGAGAPVFGAADGYVYAPSLAAVVAVSNGRIDLLPPDSAVLGEMGPGAVRIGVCAAAPCASAQLYSEGSIAVATPNVFELGDQVRYGTRSLSLAVGGINMGSAAALADAAARGVLPAGLAMSEESFSRLLRGDPAVNAPALERLTLTARDSINFYGPVNLSTIDPATGKSTLAQLAINTPALYGAGAAGEHAVLTTGTLYWNGVLGFAPTVINNWLPTQVPISQAPGAVVAGGAGTGQGVLDILADKIVFGYAPGTRVNSTTTLERMVLGFDTVNFSASQQITANNKNTLAVYRAQGGFVENQGYQYSGGNLTLSASVLTGAAGSIDRIKAGGALTVVAPAGAAPAANSGALGAELSLAAATVTVASPIALPGGKLTLSAAGDLILADGAQLDLAGRATQFYDQTRYSAGGDVALESMKGNIMQAAGSVIDLSASNNDAGRLEATALDAGAGRIALTGTIKGASSGQYDAGGTLVPYNAGQIDVRGQLIDDFAGLNRRLTANGVTGARRFTLKQGSLTVGEEIKAREIEIAVDAGSLVVSGKLDASGVQTGTIRLSARDDMTVNGKLDAHATGLRIDSYGQVIDAVNRAIVDLTTRQGTLVLAPGAGIDLRAGIGGAGVALGTLDLNVARGAGGDVLLNAANPIGVLGARRIAVNAFRAYEPAGGLIHQALLAAIDTDSTAYLNAAWNNAALQGRLAGLKTYGAAFHLRPGVELRSADALGNLVVAGDLDLHNFRYRDAAGKLTEPGTLKVRAGNALNIYGSINDGFNAPAATPDDNGWVLATKLDPDQKGVTLAQDIVVAPGMSLTLTGNPAGTETSFDTALNKSLNYAIPIVATSVNAGARIPVAVTTSAAITLRGAVTTAASISLPGGKVIAAGAILPAGTVIPALAILGAGTVLPALVPIAAMTLPAGTPLNIFNGLKLSGDVKLATGDRVPESTRVALRGAAPAIPQFRQPANGRQGQVWAIASMLPAGTESWSMQLVGGADLDAADTRARRSISQLLADHASGDVTLSDPHYMKPLSGLSKTVGAQPVFSVIRTGTGDLELLAGGRVAQESPYGIYTAGTQSAAAGGAAWNAARDLSGGTVLGQFGTQYESLVNASSAYRAYYPTGGGNVLVDAGGNLSGDFFGQTNAQFVEAPAAEGPVGNWLWTHGGGPATGRATAWWINFGTYTRSAIGAPQLTGFTGIGALGGGNAKVAAGGDAGVLGTRGQVATNTRSQGLNVAVGGTGRVLADGTLVLTGGGDLSLDVGGRLNPLPDWLTRSAAAESLQPELGGTLSNLRGHVDVRASAIGGLNLLYDRRNVIDVIEGRDDPRWGNPNQPVRAVSWGGPVLAPGDATVNMSARGDLVLAGVADPGRAFTLWMPQTAISLYSAGGNLTPVGAMLNTSGAVYYPPILKATAASGDIYYGYSAKDGLLIRSLATPAVVLAPSPQGQLEFLAAGSIRAGGQSVDLSGADPATVPTPLNPIAGIVSSNGEGGLFAGSVNSPSGAPPHAPDAEAVRFYAVAGDIIALRTGAAESRPSRTPATVYRGAKPVWVMAGRDIVGAGDPRAAWLDGSSGNQRGGNLFVHGYATDVSIVKAGRDILESSFQVAGPGTLEITAGRDIYQADQGALVSLGLLPGVSYAPGATGAGIAVQAGVGANGPDYAGFAARYLDPANLADPSRALADQPGKVARTYGDDATLGQWLLERYAGSYHASGDPREFFNALPAEQQRVYLRNVYYEELKASGREYTDPAGKRFGSYLTGRQAIAALFPETGAVGRPVVYDGDYTMFSTTRTSNFGVVTVNDSGIRTLGGGDIQLLAPGGRIVIGMEGVAPGGNAGLLTQGAGNIELYSQGSILLGLSRIMTTFGGGITAWSAQGDINAGRGSKTTLVYTPPKRVYDRWGDVTLSPQVPSSGAGIATLNPIPEVKSGDIDLIAPLGTIDAGEAGIRVSGNVNLAALQVINAANIQVQGKATGIPLAASVNVGALTAAGAASAGAAQAAQELAQNDRKASRQALGSVITVQVLGFGSEALPVEAVRPQGGISASPPPGKVQYDPRSAFQVLGQGHLDPVQQARLTETEQGRLPK